MVGLVLGAPVAAWLLLLGVLASGSALAGAAAGTAEGLRDLAQGASSPGHSGPSHPQRAASQQQPGPPAGTGAPVPPPTTRDAEGAIAFTRYYVQAFEHGYRTGDLAPLEAAQTPSCTTCTAVAGALGRTQARGVDLGDPGLSTPTVTVTGVHGDVALVHVSIDVSAGTGALSDGSRVFVPAFRAETDEHLVWTDQGWRVAA